MPAHNSLRTCVAVALGIWIIVHVHVFPPFLQDEQVLKLLVKISKRQTLPKCSLGSSNLTLV